MRNFLRSYIIELLLMGVLVLAVAYFAYLGYGLLTVELGNEVSGEEALASVAHQLEFGPRTTGSEASRRMGDWLTAELTGQDWDVLIQPYGVLAPAISAGLAITDTAAAATSSLSMVQLTGHNIIAIRKATDGDGAPAPVGIVAAPYDSRVFADGDADPSRHSEPTPGANGGASGAAILLELARTLSTGNQTVCLVFLDSEANRGVPGWQPPFGSHRFVEQLGNQIPQCANPRFAVVLGATGGVDQRLRIDEASDPELSAAIWQTAATLGHGEQFVNEIEPAVAGAYTTFVEQNIPTALITDRRYPYRNTTADTLDKVNADSLEQVAQTLQLWLEQGAPFAAD